MGQKISASLTGMFSFGSGQGCVGLSIGSSSIKLVELAKTRKGWNLLHFGMVQLPDEAITNREIVNSIAVVDGLRTLTDQIRLKNKNVCCSVSGTFLMIRRLALEVPNERELQDQIFWEAEQYLPFDATEVYMDYHVISRAKDGRTDVLLVAMKSSILDSYLAVIEDAGLQPKICDVDYFAMQNAFELSHQLGPAEATAVVDIGANALKMVVVQGGIPLFTREAVLGGRALTSEIQRHLNLSFVDAETLKVGGTGTMPQEVSDLIHIACENFAMEVKRGIDFYTGSSSGAPISSINLSGGCAKLPNLAKIIEDSCGIPTKILNPFDQITYDPTVFTPEYIAAIAPLATIAVGNAIRGASGK